MTTKEDILKLVNECIEDGFNNSHMMISILKDDETVETMGIGETELALQGVAVLFEQMIDNGYDRGELFYAVANILNQVREEE